MQVLFEPVLDAIEALGQLLSERLDALPLLKRADERKEIAEHQIKFFYCTVERVRYAGVLFGAMDNHAFLAVA